MSVHLKLSYKSNQLIMEEGESQLLAVLDTRFCLANCFTNLSSSCRYILVYPQGCDVCNHLSLFLCVADYDKLLPGMIG